MYNFLVTGDKGAWDNPEYEFPRDRFGEYSESAIMEQFKVLDANAIEELKSFPTLFVYEGNTENVRVGYLRRIKQRSKTIYIEYEFEPRIAEIPFSKIADLKTKLDIEDTGRGIGEFKRTHWAVKDENLFAILFDAGLIDQTFLNSAEKPSSYEDHNVDENIKLNPNRSDINTPQWQPKRPFQPTILIMKGGAVKGIAYVGALEILEEYGYKFNHFVGTSAGAITAALLAAGHTTTELGDILAGTNFNEFKDGWLPLSLLLLPFRKGLYKGDKFESWLEGHLRKKFPQFKDQVHILFEHLRGKRLTIFTSVKGKSFYAFDSSKYSRTQGEAITFACRCSMAIPYFFTPQMIGGRRATDGGAQNNYPVFALRDFFRNINEEPDDFLGLYLSSKDVTGKAKLFFSDLFSILSEGKDEDAKVMFIDRTIVINPSPISTLDFSLTPLEIKFLIAEGRASALDWIFQWADGKTPTQTEVTTAKQLSEALRREVIRERSKRFWTKFIIFLLLFLAVLGVGYGVYRYYPKETVVTTTPPSPQTEAPKDSPKATVPATTPPSLPPKAWAIAIEGDETKEAAKASLEKYLNMYLAAQIQPTPAAYIFKREAEPIPQRFRSVFIFNEEKDANQALLDVKQKVKNITEAKDMSLWCPNPKWEVEYFVCGTKSISENVNSDK